MQNNKIEKLECAKQKLNQLLKKNLYSTNNENKTKKVKEKDLVACGFYRIQEFNLKQNISNLKELINLSFSKKNYYLVEEEIDECMDLCAVRIIYIKGAYEWEGGNWVFEGDMDEYLYLYKNDNLYELKLFNNPSMGSCYIASKQPITNEEHISIFKNKIEQIKKK